MKRGAHIWSGFLLLAAVFLLAQCAPRTGRSLLHVFFDGVPEADSVKVADPGMEEVMPDSSGVLTGESQPESKGYLVHMPYGERECGACHDENSLGEMVEPQPGLCYMCHEDLGTQYNYLHGPVAGGYCTSCHDPHMSKKEKLLRLTGDLLCFHCHEEESVRRNEMHEDLEGMVCSDCHNPHGGEDKYIFY